MVILLGFTSHLRRLNSKPLAKTRITRPLSSPLLSHYNALSPTLNNLAYSFLLPIRKGMWPTPHPASIGTIYTRSGSLSGLSRKLPYIPSPMQMRHPAWNQSENQICPMQETNQPSVSPSTHTHSGPGQRRIRASLQSFCREYKGKPGYKTGASPYSQGGLLSLWDCTFALINLL